MSHRRCLLVAACASLLLVAAGAAGHHAFSAQYDTTKPISVSGVVTKIEWLNPHAYFFVDVADGADGTVASWACELTSPVGLMRQGWTRNSLRIGDVVEVDGIAARDGSRSLNARTVTLSDSGQKLFGRTTDEERSSAEQDRQP